MRLSRAVDPPTARTCAWCWAITAVIFAAGGYARWRTGSGDYLPLPVTALGVLGFVLLAVWFFAAARRGRRP